MEKGQEMKRKKCKRIEKKLTVRIVVVFLFTGSLAAAIYLADHRGYLPRDQNGNQVLTRNNQGEGERQEELDVTVGDIRERLTVEVQEQEYTPKQREKIFRLAKDNLETWILGDNKSLDEVHKDLRLIPEIPEYGIRISWELDRYDVMNQQGELQTEYLTDDGTLVKLTALLQYKEEKEQVEFYAKVYPPVLSKKERILKELDAEMGRLDEETKEQEHYILPSVVDGKFVQWKYRKGDRTAGILLLGIVLVFFLYVSEREKEKKQKEKRALQLMLDYPQIINQFTLYLGAGMTVRKAWGRIAEDYEERKSEKGRRDAYEEMLYTLHEIQSGISEGECYERFGERCVLSIYKKFGTMLSQNMKKGTKGLAVLLKQEADRAFEERKNLAKRLGEEAGTKMLIPLFLMLLVVLVMIVVPAFFSIQL